MFSEKRKTVLLWSTVIIVSGVLLAWYFRVPISHFLWEKFRLEKTALILNPHDSDLLYSVGSYYFNQGAYDIRRAEAYFRSAIAEDAHFFLAHYQLGRILFIQGNLDKALLEIKDALVISPDYTKSYYMYGLISGYNGDTEGAIYGFSEFIKRDSTHNWAGYNDLAWIYFKQGNFEKTREIAEVGLSYTPENPWLNTMYGTALLNLQEKERAREAFKKAAHGMDYMSTQDWGRAYPGNNPAIYEQGFEEMKKVIKHNLELVE